MRKIFRATQVFHVEEDLQSKERLLLSDYETLFTFDLNTKATSRIAGSTGGYKESSSLPAKFKAISGFHQIDKFKVIVVDKLNHCVRMINRLHRSTSRIAGRCEDFGYDNGDVRTARFHVPCNIIAGEFANEYLISDQRNNAIRLIQLETKKVSTLVHHHVNLSRPIDLVMDQEKVHLYITTMLSGVVRAHIKSKTLELLTSTDQGHRDGPLITAVFNMPWKIRSLVPSVYIVTDINNNRLRIIDVQNEVVTSICSGKVSSRKEDNITTCGPDHPYSVVLRNGMSSVIVAEHNWISELKVKSLSGEHWFLLQFNFCQTLASIQIRLAEWAKQ